MSKEDGVFAKLLSELNWRDDVRQRTIEIYESMNRQVTKGQKLKKVLAFCSYCAHEECGKIVIPEEIHRKCGLDPKNSISKIFSECQELCLHQTKNGDISLGVPNIVHTVDEFIPIFCERIELPEEYWESAVKMAKDVHEMDTNISKSPIHAAGAILQCYIQDNTLDVMYIKQIKGIANCSDMTLEQLRKHIRQLSKM